MLAVASNSLRKLFHPFIDENDCNVKKTLQVLNFQYYF